MDYQQIPVVKTALLKAIVILSFTDMLLKSTIITENPDKLQKLSVADTPLKRTEPCSAL